MSNGHQTYYCPICGRGGLSLPTSVTDEITRLTHERDEARQQLDDVCGSIPPADMAAWVENYGACENCALVLIGYDDRPYRVQCHDCATRQIADDAAAAKGDSDEG